MERRFLFPEPVAEQPVPIVLISGEQGNGKAAEEQDDDGRQEERKFDEGSEGTVVLGSQVGGSE